MKSTKRISKFLLIALKLRGSLKQRHNVMAQVGKPVLLNSLRKNKLLTACIESKDDWKTLPTPFSFGLSYQPCRFRSHQPLESSQTMFTMTARGAQVESPARPTSSSVDGLVLKRRSNAFSAQSLLLPPLFCGPAPLISTRPALWQSITNFMMCMPVAFVLVSGSCLWP
jgi:hypothetical protein